VPVGRKFPLQVLREGVRVVGSVLGLGGLKETYPWRRAQC
jgi:hypothetical protein